MRLDFDGVVIRIALGLPSNYSDSNSNSDDINSPILLYLNTNMSITPVM